MSHASRDIRKRVEDNNVPFKVDGLQENRETLFRAHTSKGKASEGCHDSGTIGPGLTARIRRTSSRFIHRCELRSLVLGDDWPAERVTTSDAGAWSLSDGAG